MAKNNKKFDVLVIGDSLPALLSAVVNAKNGFSAAILTGAESLGGLHRGAHLNTSTDNTTTTLIDTHINYLPNTKNVLQYLEQIKTYVPSLEWTEMELGALTFHNNMTQPFLGFGAHTVEGIDFYSYFTSPSQLQLNMSIAEIINQLAACFNGEILTSHEVTQLLVQDNHGLVQTNGSDVFTADRVYFFESAAKLGKIIPTDSPAFPKSVVQKLSKSKDWAVVNLAYWHKTPLTASRATHILYGAKDLPCIGAFSKGSGDLIVSQWMSILSSENFADTEQLGLTIREMKKQIKRMYPTFFDSIEKEYIVVAPEAFGAAPQAVSDNPDILKNHVLFLGSQHYATDMALAGDATSYLSLAPHFGAEAKTSEVATNT